MTAKAKAYKHEGHLLGKGVPSNSPPKLLTVQVLHGDC